MVPENENPLLWYVCKFCRRAYQRRDDLVKHKRSNHSELFLEDLAAKRRAREGEVSSESSSDETSTSSSSSNSSVTSEDESVGSGESSTAKTEINPSANKPEQVSPLVTVRDDSIFESIPLARNNLTNPMEILNSAPTSPTGPSKSNQSTNESNESENKSQEESHYWTSTPKTAGPPKSPKDSQDDTNSLDEFVTSSQTGRKMLKCDQCDRTFKQEHYRKLHITYAHDKNREYPCQFCPQIFTHPRSRVFHVTKEHVNRMCHLTLAKSAEENSVGSASRTPKRGKKKPPARVHDSQKRSRPIPNSNNDDQLSIGSNRSDGSRSNLYECDECDETFRSMGVFWMHKSFHKRKFNVQ